MANEKRLISADALEARLGGLCDEFGIDHLFIDVIVDEIGNAPTVDAVEVVRCKDCFWNDRAGRCMNPKCGKSWYGCPVPDEHFCFYGEKRESGTQPQREDV